MKAKRITALLAAAAMAVSLMTGCSSGGGEANNPSDETDKRRRRNRLIQPRAVQMILLRSVSGHSPAIRRLQKRSCLILSRIILRLKVNVTINSTDDQKSNLKVAAASDSLPDIWYNWGEVWLPTIQRTASVMILRIMRKRITGVINLNRMPLTF